MAELPADTRLGAIRLRVGDVGLLRDFYERVIGLRAIPVDDGATALGAGDRPLVELLSAPEAPVRPPQTTGLFHLALLVPTRADLARALRRVFETGGRLSGASDHLVSEALYLSDPEGNGIELYRDRPREEWPRDGDEVAMATLPLDLEGLLSEPGGDDGAPAMADGTSLGHVHLHVSDLDAASTFWVGALGLDVTASSYPGALFVSAGGYHHHVGLNIWAGVGAPRPPAGARGLDRFELVLPDTDSAAAARGRGRAGARGLDRFELVLPDTDSAAAARDRLAAVAEVRDEAGGVLVEDPSGNAVLVRAA